MRLQSAEAAGRTPDRDLPEMKTILYYIEPAIFRDDPLFLAPWQAYFRAFALRSQDRSRAFLASSQSLCALPHDIFDETVPIDSRCVLKPFGGDRMLYGRDLFADAGLENRPLLEQLRLLDDRLQPDFVICAS